VDVYTDPTFGGHRMRITPSNASRGAGKIRRLPKVGSIIVGPGVMVILAHSSGSETSFSVVEPGTVVEDIRTKRSISVRSRKNKIGSGQALGR